MTRIQLASADCSGRSVRHGDEVVAGVQCVSVARRPPLRDERMKLRSFTASQAMTSLALVAVREHSRCRSSHSEMMTGWWARMIASAPANTSGSKPSTSIYIAAMRHVSLPRRWSRYLRLNDRRRYRSAVNAIAARGESDSGCSSSLSKALSPRADRGAAFSLKCAPLTPAAQPRGRSSTAMS